MIFEKICINNMLSYYGTCEFDLTGLSPNKNVVLIYGRNNFGKTNFLNSIKLLFSGTKNDELRTVGESGQQKLTPKQYVLGKPGLWDGLLNRTARHNGEDTCSISISWQDASGDKVCATRTWVVTKNDYTEDVQVVLPHNRLTGGEAEDFFQGQLPNDFVPFFFFDGEKIQELAVGTESARAAQIERLLNISPLKVVCNQLAELTKEYGKKLLSPSARAEVKQAEAKKSQHVANIATKESELNDNQIEEQEINIELQKIKKQKEYFTVQGALNTEETIERAIQLLKEQIEVERDIINKEIPKFIIFWANPKLIGSVIESLYKEQNAIANNDIPLLGVLQDTLGKNVFDAPPFPKDRLTEEQITFYKQKIVKALGMFKPSDGQEQERSFSLSLDKCIQLREFLLRFIPGENVGRQSIVDALTKISLLKRDLNEKEEQLSGLASLSAEERVRFQELEAKEDTLHGQLIEKRAEIRNLESELENEHRQADEAEKTIQTAMDREKDALTNDERLDLSRKLNSFFARFRDELRKQKKVNIESSLNEKFKALMGSNTRIQHISVDDEFTLEYKGDSNESVGRASISAGTKQLVATSLLWALNAASDKAIPVVIDTPLARIDKDHQNRLLSNYYPNVAKQVIILPTDSEIDDEKLALITPHVYKKFALDNPDGKTTSLALID